MTTATVRPGRRSSEIARSTAVDRVVAYVRDGIAQGRWPAGAHLRETSLAEEAGVSRTPVREALQKLAASGMVEYLPNLGARVVSWTPQAIDEIYALRTMLEAYAARHAARRISGADIDRLERLCQEMEAAFAAGRSDHLDIIGKANRTFHDIIVGAADAGSLAVTLRGLVDVPLVMRTYHHYERVELERSFGHHREIVAALRAREGDWAASVMSSHIAAARNALQK